MYRATGDIWEDIAGKAGGIVGGLINQPAPTPGAVPGATVKEPIYCPEQAALLATAQAMFPNNQAQRDLYILTHGPGFGTTGGWAGWCALLKAGQIQPPGAQSFVQPGPQPVVPSQTISTTPVTPWTTYAAIGAGVVGLVGIVWYLKK